MNVKLQIGAASFGAQLHILSFIAFSAPQSKLGSPAHSAVCWGVGCQYTAIIRQVNTFPLPSGLLFSNSGVVSVLRRPSGLGSDEHVATAPVHQAGKDISSLTVYHAGYSLEFMRVAPQLARLPHCILREAGPGGQLLQ